MALKVKASSGLTSSCNSKVVKDTTGEDLISTSLQLGSECRIRSCGWTSGAQLEPTWSSSSTQCQKLSTALISYWSFLPGHCMQHQPCTGWERAFTFVGRASLCVMVAVCMCSQHTSHLVKAHKCTEHRTLLCKCLHTLTKLSLRWQLILNDVLQKSNRYAIRTNPNLKKYFFLSPGVALGQESLVSDTDFLHSTRQILASTS